MKEMHRGGRLFVLDPMNPDAGHTCCAARRKPCHVREPPGCLVVRELDGAKSCGRSVERNCEPPLSRRLAVDELGRGEWCASHLQCLLHRKPERQKLRVTPRPANQVY